MGIDHEGPAAQRGDLGLYQPKHPMVLPEHN